MLRITPRPGIVSGEETGTVEPLVHGLEIGRSCQNIRMRIERIGAQSVLVAQLVPGAGHELHQAHRTPGRDSARIAIALGHDNRAHPAFGDAETLRCLGDMGLVLVENGSFCGGNDGGGYKNEGAQSVHSGTSLPMMWPLVTGPK